MSYIKRAPLSQETKERVYDYAARTQMDENGQMVSPNGTGKVISEETKIDIGHRDGFENRYETEFSEKAGLTQEEHNNLFTNPGTLQIEPRDENRSHLYESKDHNDAMQNISAYAYSQDKDIAANTYINPSENGKSGTITVVNAQTGEESTVCTYDLSGNEAGESSTAADASVEADADMDADVDAETDDDADTL